jgi:ferredoxin
MTAPTVYEVGEDGVSHLLKHEPSPEEMSVVRDAADACPTQALLIRE